MFNNMEFAVWSIGIIFIAIVAYLFMLFAYSSMEEPRNMVYYNDIKKTKSEKTKELSKVVLAPLVKK